MSKSKSVLVPQVSFLRPDGAVRPFSKSKRVKNCHACKRPFYPDELHSIMCKGKKYVMCLDCCVAYKTKVFLLGGE